jgi:hypothetical protein
MAAFSLNDKEDETTFGSSPSGILNKYREACHETLNSVIPIIIHPPSLAIIHSPSPHPPSPAIIHSSSPAIIHPPSPAQALIQTGKSEVS